jgi:hypothetical protein
VTLAGADLEELDGLRREFDRRADQLERLTWMVSAEVGGLRRLWIGADGAGFVHVWETRHRSLLLRAAAELRAAGATVERNRAAQRDTSEADGGAIFGPPAHLTGLSVPGLGWFSDRLDDVEDGVDWMGGHLDDGVDWLDDQVDDGVDWFGDRVDDGVDWFGDRVDDGVDWFEDRVEDAEDGLEWLGDRAVELWDAAMDAADAAWDGLKTLGVAALNEAADQAIAGLLRVSQALKYLGNQSLASPLMRYLWNRHLNPALVTDLYLKLDWLVPDSQPSGDLEARPPWGDFPVRSSADFDPDNPDETLPRPFSVQGGTATEVGRNAIIRTLEDTSADYGEHQIYADEFEIIDHGNNRYTVVLPGVTDLTNPKDGLNPHNRSVRDTDYAAARSASSADVSDNAYAMMVQEYIRDQVPAGASLAIVGHSFGGDTAVDLAADPVFNGEQYNVTHVVAAAYHSEPQLAHVANGTEVLVLQNTRDIPVVVEELGHASSTAELLADGGEGIVIEEFEGGWKGLGHHQDHYINYVGSTDSDKAEGFFAGWAEAGYGEDGEVTAVDVSVWEW